MKSYSIKSVILAVFLIGMINPAEARFEDGQIINLRSALSTNRFVAPRDGSSADRAYISIHSERGAKKDPINWTLDIAGGGYFYLKGASGKVMEVKNGSSNARTSVWLKRKTGSDAQKFKFRSAGNGYYYIIPKINPHLVLDVKGGYTYEGAGIWTHPHNGTKAQKIRVIEALKQYKLAVTINYRWGDKGCLRYGAGTFYEKAHLLKSMLHEAGFEAKLLYGPFDIDKTGWDKVFFYPYDLPFDADFPRAIQKETFRSRPIEAIKLDDQRVDQVFQNIKKSMPEDMRYVDPDWSKLVEFIDVVELEYEGQKVLLNPSIRDAEFGKSYIERVQGASNKNQRRENIWVRLSLINSSEPHRPITFIENTFSPEQLFGNQLAIQFQSHLSTYDQLTLPRNRNQTFTPVMGLTGPNITAEEQQQFVKKGKTIRINGDTLEVKNNQLIVNDHPVLKGEEHPELRKQVRTLKGKVWPDAFPKVDLRFRADDKNDEMVNGLAGPDFDLLENGIPVPFECHPQKRDSQKVLLLFDFSGSVPKNFKDEQAVTFAKTLMESVQQQVPDAQFRAATLVGLIHYKLVLAPKWTKDISELEKQMVHIKGLWDHCSSIWNALADATQEADADLIVIVTDGDSAYDGNLTEKKKIVARGCPVVALGVGEDQNKDCLDEMAVLSSGIYRSVTEHQEAISFISTFANDLKFRPYFSNASCLRT